MEGQERQKAEVQSEPELLYHYTTQEGLLGIIEKKHIWATHLRYLNDTSEGKIVPQVILNELNSRLNSDAMMQLFGMQPVEHSGKIICEDEEIHSQGIAMSSWVTSQDVYVTSFSKEGNLLSQWRAYSGESVGYSIGFSSNYLRAIGEHFLQDNPGRFYSDLNGLNRCHYFEKKEEASLKKEIEDIVSSYIAEASAKKQSIPEIEVSRRGIEGFYTPGAIALKYFLPLGTRSAITKDAAFYEEAEWRLAFHVNTNQIQRHSDIKFRTGRSGPVPYLEVPLILKDEFIGIWKIIVGPCQHPDEAVNSVKMLLEREGFKGIEVVPSRIPYRNK